MDDHTHAFEQGTCHAKIKKKNKKLGLWMVTVASKLVGAKRTSVGCGLKVQQVIVLPTMVLYRYN